MDEEAPSLVTDKWLFENWEQFRRDYAKLGYRKKSYELFSRYLAAERQVEMSGPEVQRRLHAYRKRLRQRRKTEP